MLSLGRVEEVREMVRLWRAEQETVGLVPTMGAIHEGHLALIKQSRQDNQRTLVSVFLNPLQFGPQEDLARYPQNLEADMALLSEIGCDAVFAPTREEMYPTPPLAKVLVDDLATRWLGQIRPGHFDGVTTVCAKLFHIINPDRVYFGEKDFQQLTIIRQMINDLNFPLALVSLPTVREENGLAMSSRNVYLSTSQRQQAGAIYEGLVAVSQKVTAGEQDVPKLTSGLQEFLQERIPDARIQYATIVESTTLTEVAQAKPGHVILVALYLGGILLHDSWRIGTSEEL